MKKLQILCPQEYDGAAGMRVANCNRCTVGWNKKLGKCTIETGAEHLELVPAHEVPTCPMQEVCQHQVQSETPCAVRSKGLICESALIWSGLSEAEAFDHPLSFNATMMA